jgi:hypothetical protein
MGNTKLARKPRMDVTLTPGDHLVVRTRGEKVLEGVTPGWKYVLEVDEFGVLTITKELRNYG